MNKLEEIAGELGIKPGKPRISFDFSELDKNKAKKNKPSSDTLIGPSEPRFQDTITPRTPPEINLPSVQEVADKDWPQTNQETCKRLPTHID